MCVGGWGGPHARRPKRQKKFFFNASGYFKRWEAEPKNPDMRPSITESRLFEQLKQHPSFGEKHSFNVTGDTEEPHVELIIPKNRQMLAAHAMIKPPLPPAEKPSPAFLTSSSVTSDATGLYVTLGLILSF